MIWTLTHRRRISHVVKIQIIHAQSDEFYGVSQISLVSFPWKHHLWSMMKKSSVSRIQRFKYIYIYIYLQILCYVLERWIRTQHQILFGRQIDVVQKFTRIQSMRHNWWWANGIRVEYLPKIHHIAAPQQSPRVHVKMIGKPEESTGRIIFMSMFNDIMWGTEDSEQECNANADLVLINARRFPPGTWSFFGPGSEWFSTHGSRPQGERDRVAESMMIKFGESGHPVSVPRDHCPDERLKAKEVENCQYTSALMGKRLNLFFAQLFSVNQRSIYGTVSDQARSGKLVIESQSDPLFVMKTPTPSTEDLAQEDLL